MAVKKERRSTPRKPAPGAQTPLSDTLVTKSTTPQREVPDSATDEEQPSEQPSPEDIRRRIEMQAYFKAKARGFAPGYELQDWLEAEREVKQRGGANRP